MHLQRDMDKVELRTITNPNFDGPTTVAAFGNRLYAVNARFGTPNPSAATYNIVQVERKSKRP